ncbi:MAG: hypothetical protein MHPSP_004525, partial [Paramarteilia canceri]
MLDESVLEELKSIDQKKDMVNRLVQTNKIRLVEREMKVKKNKISAIWNYFMNIEYNDKGNFIKTPHIACSKCFFPVLHYNVDNGTTNLSRHLKNCCSNLKIEGFTQPKKIKISKEDSETFNQLIVDFITSTFSPMKIVEDPDFKTVIQKSISFGAKYGNIDACSIIQGRKAVRSSMDTKYKSVELEIIEKLATSKAKAFSSDLWSSTNGNFLDISYSLIENFEIKNGQFQMIHFTDSHTGDNILEKLIESFEKIGLAQTW